MDVNDVEYTNCLLWGVTPVSVHKQKKGDCVCACVCVCVCVCVLWGDLVSRDLQGLYNWQSDCQDRKKWRQLIKTT